MRIYDNYNLFSHNTFGIEAKCKRYMEYESIAEAQEVARQLSEPFLIIGGGSNLLLTQDYAGTVVRSAITGTEVIEDDNEHVLVRIGSGEEWDNCVDYFVKQGWHGAENLSLIPGDIGASAVQNIGAYGAEVCNLIETIEAVRIGDGEVVKIEGRACGYGYRQSKFKQEWKNKFLITHVTYRLTHSFEPNIDYAGIQTALQHKGITQPTPQQLRDCIIDIRREKLPDHHVEGNAGSFFMNPVVSKEHFEELLARYPQMPHYHIDEQHEKIPAGWLIDQCGWKGRSIGRAGVHARQALVLVNRGGATGQEIVDLCVAIQKDVKDHFGIAIYPEVNII